MAAWGSRHMSSMQVPTGLKAAKVPPSTLLLPGPTHSVVTPLRTASRRASSKGLMPSMARRWGVTGSLYSL